MNKWQDFKPGSRVRWKFVYDRPAVYGTVVRREWHGKLDPTTAIVIKEDDTGRITKLMPATLFIDRGALTVVQET